MDAEEKDLPVKDQLKKRQNSADKQNIGHVVPLPNHYMSDMPQGAGAGENRPF